MLRTLILFACLALAPAAAAHGPAKGANGGVQVDAGDYHVELVPAGTALTLYLSDKDDKPVDAASHKATALLLVEGKALRVELKPDGVNRLTGTSTAPVPPAVKGAVQITLPSGKTVQAKFE